MDPRTLWLTRPDDRYQPNPALRSAERAIYLLLQPRPSAPVRKQEQRELSYGL